MLPLWILLVLVGIAVAMLVSWPIGVLIIVIGVVLALQPYVSSRVRR